MFFETFDLPRALTLDAADLDKRFYALSRKYHPDLFSRRPAAEQQEALDRSAVLNDAYRTLKDPVKRANYVLTLEGLGVDEASSKQVPPELLEEVFELNMLLEDAEPGSPEIEEARKRFEGMRDEADADLAATFTQWDQTHSREALTAVRGLLNRRKYITNLIGQTSVSD